MAKITVVFGLLLIGNGVYGYTASDSGSWTALIPAFVGAVLLLCGVVAAAKPKLNMHFMHVSALIGLLGCLAALGRLVSSFFKEEQNGLVQADLGLVQANLGLMALLCGGYVFVCFRSFKEAGRRRREAAKQLDS